MNRIEKIEKIYNIYWNHKKGYITTVEDFLLYLSSNEFNYALWANWKLIWNQMRDQSYFEIDDIKLWVTIENQGDKVIDWFYNLIK